jgi:homocysteine S-methyltransferase
MNLNYPILLDGGLSNELEKAGFDLSHQLWSAKLIATASEAIIEAHLSYLKAGAQCIITSSYQATMPGLVAAGYNKSESEQLILKTVSLAETAIDRHLSSGYIGARPLVGASIGPYGAYLADGSEYRGDYGVSDQLLQDFHLPRIELLDKTSADLLACETIPSIQEVKVIAKILEGTEKPSWISLSCKDGSHLNDGTPIEDCVSLLTEHPNVFAIGVNCTAPKYISSLISKIKSGAGSKKIVVYPNSGEIYNAQTKTWAQISDHEMFLKMSEEWLDLGADIIGGCCQIGPSQIASLSEQLSRK